MGEIADMMLEGIMCSQCGEWMDEMLNCDTDSVFDVPGHPCLCVACQEAEQPAKKTNRRLRSKKR